MVFVQLEALLVLYMTNVSSDAASVAAKHLRVDTAATLCNDPLQLGFMDSSRYTDAQGLPCLSCRRMWTVILIGILVGNRSSIIRVIITSFPVDPSAGNMLIF